MNPTVVAATAAGLGSWLHEHHASPTVVIGYDARHQSESFALDLAEVLAGAGVSASLLPEPTPTPVLAYAIGYLGADAGVMVTASHNPATDNGLKVYLGDTSQIASPVDDEIAAHIRRVSDVDSIPRSSEFTRLTSTPIDSYVDSVVALVDHAPRCALSVAYTPLHGVGRDIFARVLERAGFTDVLVVPEQAEPDPDFPTVAFPNPEEPGAMNLVLDLGEKRGVDIVLAHDPDADRCAVAVGGVEQSRVLTGDEVGVLLGDHLLRHGRAGTYASSIVSSDLLGSLAAAHGQPWQQTLTGFKWIGKIPALAFGYEEALGYCVAPHLSRDKDGIAAALMVLDLAAELKAVGQTLTDRLDELSKAHGFHLTDQIAVRLSGSTVLAEWMARFETEARSAITAVHITSVANLRDGFRGLPPDHGLRLGFDQGRIFVRPSGTEPKLKIYVEVIDEDEIVGQARLDLICSDLRHYVASAT